MMMPTTTAAAATSEESTAELDRVDCGVIIVTYNSADDVVPLLASLPAAAPGLRIRTVVVDNASSDTTWNEITHHRDVVAVAAGGNLGYAGGINVGREHVGPCDTLLLLNPDLTLEAGAITALFDALKASKTGVVVPMILDQHGELYTSIRREPTLLRAAGDACLGSRLGKRPGWSSETVHDPAQYTELRRIEWASGAALLIGEQCNRDVGPWDEQRFFLYSEETDFFRRARRAGYTCLYVPKARVVHEQGGSGTSAELSALMAVNRVRYYEKYHSRPSSAVFRAVVALGELLRIRQPHHRLAFRRLLRRKSWQQLLGEPRPMEPRR